MGPHATLAESTVRENIMTGIHFWGCKSRGVYDRHNEVVQTTMAFFKYELKFSGSTGSVDSSLVGFSGKGTARHTDGQVSGGPFTQQRVACNASMVDQNALAVSHSGTGACSESFLLNFSTRMQGPA